MHSAWFSKVLNMQLNSQLAVIFQVYTSGGDVRSLSGIASELDRNHDVSVVIR